METTLVFSLLGILGGALGFLYNALNGTRKEYESKIARAEEKIEAVRKEADEKIEHLRKETDEKIERMIERLEKSIKEDFKELKEEIVRLNMRSCVGMNKG